MKQKKVVFSDNENQYARLVTRLRYDKLTQGSFFRELVSLYVDNDIDFAKVIAKGCCDAICFCWAPAGAFFF